MTYRSNAACSSMALQFRKLKLESISALGQSLLGAQMREPNICPLDQGQPDRLDGREESRFGACGLMQ
jgi:hypothetical protein